MKTKWWIIAATALLIGGAIYGGIKFIQWASKKELPVYALADRGDIREVQRSRKCPPCPPCGEEPADTTATGVDPANADLLTDRPPNYPGFVPAVRTLSSLPESEYLTPTPELTFQPAEPDQFREVFTITPDLGGWKNLPKVKVYLCTPGDYTDWGSIPADFSGEPGSPVVFRYYEPGGYGYSPPHPYYLTDRSANFEGVQVGKPNGAKWITFHGLSFRGKGFEKDGAVGGEGVVVYPGSSHIVFDYCHFYKARGLRIYGDSSTVQNCVLNGNMGIRGDHGGTGIYTVEAKDSRGNRIVSNEFFDLTADAIGLPKDGTGAEKFGNVPGTIIADNDIYTTDESKVVIDGQTFVCGGDGLDIKNGGYPDEPVLIEGNRIWGIWPTPPKDEWGISCGDNTGTVGQPIVTHKDTRNVIIRNNLILDSSTGIACRPGEVRDMASFNIAILNNLIYRISEPIPDKTGYGILATTQEVDIFYNSIHYAGKNFITKDGKEPIRIFANRLIETIGTVLSKGKQVVGENVYTADIPLSDMVVWRKRWTGPEKINLQGVAPGIDAADEIAKYPDGKAEAYLSETWFFQHIKEVQ